MDPTTSPRSDKANDPIGLLKVQLTRVDAYTTFVAEHGLRDGNIIVHFFLPRPNGAMLDSATLDDPEAIKASADRAARTAWLISNRPDVARFWLTVFPAILEKTVTAVFKATPPRVQAGYVPEVSSWWLEARGFLVFDPTILVMELFEKLDHDLDEAGAGALLGDVVSTM